MITPLLPQEPPVVPDYEMLRCVGRGAYGQVWMARSTMGSLRAVKVIYLANFDSERPYLREFAGIRDFEPVSMHESQVHVYHVGQNLEAGYFYYVMDLADDASAAARAGHRDLCQDAEVSSVPVRSSAAAEEDYVPATLSLRLLEQGRLPVKECLEIAAALASALAHLHAHGLVHRDIKPSNLVFVNGRPKLADIGLVSSATSAATFVGTTGYIPPEGPGGPLADIYSLGKVLYEMMSGRDRCDFPLLPEGFPTLAERVPLLEFNQVVLKACQNDPAQRYRSANELLADVETLRLGKSLRRRQRVRKQLVRGGLTLASVLAIWGGTALWQKIAQTHPPPPPDWPVAGHPAPGEPFTNTLGMRFVPVPDTKVLFCAWSTRVRDYASFVDATLRKRGWQKPSFRQGPTHPAVNVTWEDASIFCEWLTQHERTSGALGTNQIYRLPSDEEWSRAVGLENEPGLTPQQRNMQVKGVYPWGTQWPPPQGAGNYADVTLRKVSPGRAIIENYDDGYGKTSPVGTFPPNQFGLYDMGGNVWQWCESLYGHSGLRVMRGASWLYWDERLSSSFRNGFGPLHRADDVGFRVVLDLESPPPGKDDGGQQGNVSGQPAKEISESVKESATLPRSIPRK